MLQDHIRTTGVGRMLARAVPSPLIRLLLLGLVLAFAFQGTRGLWSPDEGRYVAGALQMLDSGNYFAPAYSSTRINFSKPPITYWAIAAAIKMFGHNTWAVRTPYALSFIGTLWLLYGMGRLVTREKPWLPGLIYACMLFPLLSANIVSTDVLLTFFEAIAMLGFLRLAWPEDGSPRRSDALLMWLGFGLAFLTKGPPGLIPLLAVLPFMVRRDGWSALRRIFPVAGVLLFVVTGLLWYVIAVLRYPWLVHYFLHQEVYQRLFTHAQRRHPGALGWIVVYLPTLLLGALPWWPGLGRFWRGKAGVESGQRWRDRRTVEHFLLLWFLLPLLVFCLVQSRLPLYVLPLFLPLSLILAGGLQHRVDLGIPRQRAWLIAWLLLLLAIKGGIAYLAHPAADDRLAARQLTAMTEQHDYTAIAFIKNTSLDYDIEELTPWGLRFYMNKPIYGIAWRSPDHDRAICEVAQQHRSVLLVGDRAVDTNALDDVLADCRVRQVISAGTWRGSTLTWIRT